MKKPILAAMLSCHTTKLKESEKFLFSDVNPLGVTLFGRNIENKAQLKELIRSIKESIGREDVLIAVDQEGGRVRRLAEPEFSPYLSQSAIGSMLPKKNALETAKLHAALISHDMKECGFNLNYAPVLDLVFSETTAAIVSRSFGNDEKLTAELGKLMVDEYIGNGILPCIKHMPGHGRAAVDPHLNLPRLPQSLDELAKDFYPFQQLCYAPVGMTAHIVIEAVDNQHPVTQSKKAIDEIIRGIIGFDGFLISDAIDMKALKGSLTERTEASLAAGCDAVCCSFGNADYLYEVCSKCRYLSDKSMIRFAKLKNIINNKISTGNTAALKKRYHELSGKVEKYDDDYDATEVLNKMQQVN